MGLFGIAIGKKAVARKNEYKLAKYTVKTAAKTARTETRQAAKTDRTIERQAGHTSRVEEREATKGVAYANGIVPADPLADVAGMFSTGVKGVASFFGGNSQSSDPNGIYSDTQGQVYGSPVPGSSADLVPDAMANMSGVSPVLLIGGALLLFMLLKKK